jgi:hypothetical protein
LSVMLYIGNPVRGKNDDVPRLMSEGRIGCMVTPAQGNPIPPNALWAADNGKFGKGWPGYEGWYDWLVRKVIQMTPRDCLFATAPDVVGNGEATFHESRPWLVSIRHLKIPAAFVAQNGSERDLIPWGEFDVLFIGGTMECPPCNYVRPTTEEEKERKDCPLCGAKLVEWKLGPEAASITRDAIGRGIPVHMGRVNSERRMKYAISLGCTTVDGTYLKFGPDTNLPKLIGWFNNLGLDNFTREATVRQ